jgi:hypothetical protein
VTTVGGCAICGVELYAARQCVMKVSLPEEKQSLVPAHCYRCHFQAIAVANGTYKGQVLPPPHAQPTEADASRMKGNR